jgi:hypothetical protein
VETQQASNSPNVFTLLGVEILQLGNDKYTFRMAQLLSPLHPKQAIKPGYVGLYISGCTEATKQVKQSMFPK